MKKLVLSFLLSSISILNAQNYVGFRNTLNEGNFWFYEQQFDSALVYFSKAEKYNLDFFVEEAHLFSRTLWELGYRKKSIKVLLKWGFSDFFVNDTTYYNGLNKSGRLKISRKLKSVEKDLLYSNMDFFDDLHKKDQMYRQVILQYPVNSFKHDSIRDLMVFQDSLNFLDLIDEIKRHGYPGGYIMAPIGPGAILIHSKPEWLLKYSYLFQKEIEAGRMSFHDYSKAFDRGLSKRGDSRFKPYNAYFPTNDETIISPLLVFYNRCLIGMSPYYDIYLPRVYRRGTTPQKSAFYDYYKTRKENFNCLSIKQ